MPDAFLELCCFHGKKEGDNTYPALCHMLDVGILAQVLVKNLDVNFQKNLLESIAPEHNIAFEFIGFLGAIHDIGKISSGFQYRKMGFSHREYGKEQRGSDDHKLISYKILFDYFNEQLGFEHTAYAIISASHHGEILCNGDENISQPWAKVQRKVIAYLISVFSLMIQAVLKKLFLLKLPWQMFWQELLLLQIGLLQIQVCFCKWLIQI